MYSGARRIRFFSASRGVPRSARVDIGFTPAGAPRWPVLLTPGPLTTSATTKAAMLVDFGSRDGAFTRVVADVRRELLSMAGSSAPAHECVIVQGSGTFGVEAVLGSAVPRDGKLLVASNGAYGLRMASIARVLGIPLSPPITRDERAPLVPAEVIAAAAADPTVTHVAVVHHETTAGVLNDVDAIGKGLAALPHAPAFIVDSMSGFGAHGVDVVRSRVAFLISSSNKCIEGVPGFSFAICERGALAASRGRARSLALDIHAQWAALEAGGQFRFTPPTHALLAFAQALREHAAEGGTAGRLARYASNREELLRGMAALGLQPYVRAPHAGEIITTFVSPDDANWNFTRAYDALAAKGYVLYPGKTAAVDSFRVGSIGRIFPQDMRDFLKAFEEELRAQGVKLPVKQKSI